MIALQIRGQEVLSAGAKAKLSTGQFSLTDHDEPSAILLTLPTRLEPEAYRPGLKVIGTCTTGVQHIDHDLCKRHGIKVISLEGDRILEQLTATAEHTIALILMITRNLPGAVDAAAQGRWFRQHFVAQQMLSRMTLGIIGAGRIGRMVAARASAFGLRVFYDEWGCDIVSLHVPLTAETMGMVDAGMIALSMKRGAYLINTARGEVVNDDAVLDALAYGSLAGYAADVLSGEFEPGFDAANHPMVKAVGDHNIILTPHIGGSTTDSWEISQLRIIDRLEAACLS